MNVAAAFGFGAFGVLTVALFVVVVRFSRSLGQKSREPKGRRDGSRR